MRFFLLLLLFVIACFFSLFGGRMAVDPLALLDTESVERQPSVEQLTTLLFKIRLPRMLLAILSGMSLALSGYLFQTLFQNPLVSPDVLGVSSGCSFGAVLSIVLFQTAPPGRQFFALLFGMIAVALALALARVSRGERLLGLIIAGIVVSSMSSSAIMLLKYFADPFTQLPAIEFWLMGGLYHGRWRDITAMLPLLLPIFAAVFLLSWQIKVVGLGDEQAQSLGLRPFRLRATVLFLATVLVARVVSSTGLIAWVALLAPHLGRYIFKTLSIRRAMAAVMLTGAVLLLLADIVAKNLLESEMPISIPITFIGGPFLAVLLYRNRHRLWL